MPSKITESEAIETLDMLFSDSTNCYYPFTEKFSEALKKAINALEKQEKIKEIIANANQWSKEDILVKAQAYCDIEKILRSDEEYE